VTISENNPTSFPEFQIITLKRQLDRIYKIYRIIGNQRLAGADRTAKGSPERASGSGEPEFNG
jgi:hypothetical protein